jgi:hypothetical protein
MFGCMPRTGSLLKEQALYSVPFRTFIVPKQSSDQDKHGVWGMIYIHIHI